MKAMLQLPLMSWPQFQVVESDDFEDYLLHGSNALFQNIGDNQGRGESAPPLL